MKGSSLFINSFIDYHQLNQKVNGNHPLHGDDLFVMGVVKISVFGLYLKSRNVKTCIFDWQVQLKRDLSEPRNSPQQIR